MDIDKLIDKAFVRHKEQEQFTFRTLVEMVEEVMGEDPLEEEAEPLEEQANTLAADVNEIMLGYYALGGSWDNFEDSELAQRAIDQRIVELGNDVFEVQAGRAKEMAKSTIEWANANGFEGNPVKVWWTARPNSLSRAVGQEVDSRKNPTDTLFQFADDSFLGVSAKSTKGAGDIGFKNPGIGSLSKALNIDLSQYVIQTTQDTIDELGLPASGVKRKQYIRANPEIRKQTVAVGTKILNTLRGALLSHLSGLDQEDIRSHIVGMWMDADESYPYYIKVTGHGSKEPFSVSIMDPLNNPKLKALLADDVEVMEVGNDSVGITAGGKRIMKMRFKYASEKLASSVKLSGDPWADRKSK